MSGHLVLTRDLALSTRESFLSCIYTAAKQTQRFHLRNPHFLFTGRHKPRQLQYQQQRWQLCVHESRYKFFWQRHGEFSLL